MTEIGMFSDHRLSRLGQFACRPFVVRGSRIPTVAIVRIVFGLILFHQAIDSLGFVALLGPVADQAGWHFLRGAALAAAVVFGVLTPWASVGLLLHICLPPAFQRSLGDQIAVIVLWGILFLGGGRSWSVDALLLKQWPRLANRLGLGLGATSTEARAAARFITAMLFWSICLGAMLYHLGEVHWMRGDALSMALTSGFYSDHSVAFRNLADTSPRLFIFVCTISLAVQAVWEMLLVPLAYCRWGWWFVVLQGLAFFACSILLLNLQYLPLFEICLWGMLFAPEAAPKLAPGHKSVGRLRGLAPVAMAVCVALVAVNFAIVGVMRWQGTHPVLACPSFYPYFYLTAQCGANVFNKGDLAATHAHLVLYEIDSQGRPLRVVPLSDWQGQRLRYFRNDVFLYHRALGWHFLPAEMQYQTSPAFQASSYSRSFARDVATLDATLTNRARRHGEQWPDGRRVYRAELFDRDGANAQSKGYWGPARHVGGWTIEITAEQSMSPTWPVFDLPPGHWFESRRTRDTKRMLDIASHIVHASQLAAQ